MRVTREPQLPSLDKSFLKIIIKGEGNARSASESDAILRHSHAASPRTGLRVAKMQRAVRPDTVSVFVPTR